MNASLLHRAAAASFVLAAAAIAHGIVAVRTVEAVVTCAILRPLGAQPDRLRTTVWVQTPSSWPAGVQIVNSCSAGVLLIPIAVACGLVVATGRVSTWRALASFVLVGIIAVAMNQVRYAVILLAIHQWGFDAGFHQTHVLIGSVISAATVIGATALAYRLLWHRGDDRG